MNEMISTTGQAPGMAEYAQLFQNYRISGVKFRFTPIMDLRVQETAGNEVVPAAFIYAGDGLLVNPSVSNIPEQRWAVYKVLNNWRTGGAVKSVSMYVSAMKVAGGDRTVSNDIEYTGTCNTTAPYYNPPNAQLGFQIGVFDIAGGNLVAARMGEYILTATTYVTFWGRRSLNV